MKNDYSINHIVDSFYSKGSTKFLNPKEYLQVKNKLPKNLQKVYKPFPEANKVIIYNKEIPDIIICKITFKSPVRHPMVLKELFVLGLKEETFGDIIVRDNTAYIFLLEELFEYIKYNFSLNKISISSIEKLDRDYLADYEVEYDNLELLVSSLRIDNVISSITNDSRKNIVERFKNKEVILNYNIVTKYSINLEENDVFSIRRFGKYKYNNIIKTTKKGSLIISVTKYK